MKKILSVLLSIMFIFSLVACNSENKKENAKKAEISIAALKGPTGVGMANLMEKSDKGDTNNKYNFTIATSPDEITGKFVSGEINIASLPTNLAAKLNSKTGGKVRILAINTLGVLSIIENGNSIKTFSDLKDKTLYLSGEGTNTEYILKYLLNGNKIDVNNDINLNFVATNDELIAALVSGKADCALIPEPAATTALNKNENLKRAISINDEWKKITKSELTMGAIVALNDFIKENKNIVEKFLEEYEKSISTAKEDINSTAKLCEKYQIIPSFEVAKKSIPNCNLTFLRDKDLKKNATEYYKVLNDFDPTSIGGKLPENEFYYEK